MAYLFNFDAFIEELRENEEKKKTLDAYEAKYGKIEPDITKQVWYIRYVKNFIKYYPKAGLLVPEDLEEDFDWVLLQALVAASFSSDYRFEVSDVTTGKLRLLIKVTMDDDEDTDDENDKDDDGNEEDKEREKEKEGLKSIEKTLDELWSFQILRLFEIYIEEQMGLLLEFEAKGDVDQRYYYKRQKDYKIRLFKNKIKSIIRNDDEVKEIVYHYTSVNTFSSILRSKSLRATDLRFLNDKTEKKIWDSVFSDSVNEVVSSISSKINSKSIDAKIDDVKEFVDRIGHIMKTHMDKECYIISLSKLADDKNQFDMYGDSSKGLSIGFYKEQLLDEIDDKNASSSRVSGLLSGPVSYDLQEVKDDVVDILEEMVDEFIKEKKSVSDFINEYEYSFNGHICDIFLRCQDAKNPFFKSEEEFRLYWMQETSDRSKEVDIFARNCKIIPFVTLSFINNKLPLAEIIVGPDNKPEVKSNIESVLRLFGYTDVTVKVSEIPYTS